MIYNNRHKSRNHFVCLHQSFLYIEICVHLNVYFIIFKNSFQSAGSKKKFEHQAKEEILREADIIICTLNFSGNQILDCLTAERNNGKTLINTIIIDEVKLFKGLPKYRKLLNNSSPFFQARTSLHV